MPRPSAVGIFSIAFGVVLQLTAVEISGDDDEDDEVEDEEDDDDDEDSKEL